MVDAMLGASGFAREATFTDARGWFAVHVARAQHRRPRGGQKENGTA
jgi:hypothetical protein